MGNDVLNFQVGDYAGVPWLYFSCGSCEYCVSGWETLCLKQKNSGYTVPGCFRQFITVPASHAIHIPKSLNFDQAARKFQYCYRRVIPYSNNKYLI